MTYRKTENYSCLFIRWGRCSAKSLEAVPSSHLYLSGSAKPRGKRRKQCLTCRGIRSGRGPEQTHCIRPIAFVGVVRHVEELGERLQLGMLAGPKRLQDAHVKIREWAAAHAVAAGHVSVDDGAVIIVVAVVLRVESNRGGERRSGAVQGDCADGKTVRQIKNAANAQIVPDVILGRTGVKFRQER